MRIDNEDAQTRLNGQTSVDVTRKGLMYRARFLLALAILMPTVPTLARSDYHPERNWPTFAVAVDSEFLFPRIGWRRHAPKAGHDKWNVGALEPRTGSWRNLSDWVPLPDVQCLARNRTTLFAGAWGLAACSIADGTWQPVLGLDSMRIITMFATDTVLWLGTSGSGLIRYDLRTGGMRRWNRTHGLGGNNVSAIHPLPDRVLVGTWRRGVQERDNERSTDWFGRGLYAITNSNGCVQRVQLPSLPAEWEIECGRRWLITGILPAPDRDGILHLLVWHPWDTWCLEYSTETDRCTYMADARFLCEHIPIIARRRSDPTVCANLAGPLLFDPPPMVGGWHSPHNRLAWLRQMLTPTWTYRRLRSWRCFRAKGATQLLVRP